MEHRYAIFKWIGYNIQSRIDVRPRTAQSNHCRMRNMFRRIHRALIYEHNLARS